MKKIYTTFFFISIALVVASIIVLAVFGLNLGVDFTGGSVSEVTFAEGSVYPSPEKVQQYLVETHPEIQSVIATPTDERGMIIRTNALDEVTHRDMIQLLANEYGRVSEGRFDSIGPTIGGELKSKSIKAIIIVLIVITIYIAIVFRGMSEVLSPWVMGFAAIVALVHDILVPAGIFALLGYFGNVEISAVFVAAVLTILGYSVSDTVIVFDRIRENVQRSSSKVPFDDIIHKSVLQTVTRSVNTSLTTIVTLLAIFFFGGETIKYFALALILGIGLGTYSSIFMATPIVAWWGRKKPKK